MLKNRTNKNGIKSWLNRRRKTLRSKEMHVEIKGKMYSKIRGKTGKKKVRTKSTII